MFHAWFKIYSLRCFWIFWIHSNILWSKNEAEYLIFGLLMLSLGSFYLILLPLVFSDQYTRGYWFINIGTVLHFFIKSGMFSWSRHSLKWLLIQPYKAVKFLSQNPWRNSGHAFPVGHTFIIFFTFLTVTLTFSCLLFWCFSHFNLWNHSWG